MRKDAPTITDFSPAPIASFVTRAIRRLSMRCCLIRYLVPLVAVVTVFTGCRDHMPHSATWPATGDEIKTHPKPPEGGYYTNWDPYADTITLEPADDVNPVKTQHVLIATVRDKDGKPLPNRRIEWIISDGSVGDIVEVDESGFRASRGMKLTNRFAISHTNNYSHTITRGDDDPNNDFHLEPGQTWCVITSPLEGDTHVTAYCPAIFDWNKHKVFAVKHWFDVQWEWPPPATNPVGSPHELITRVMKRSDRTPLANWVVNYKLLDGPAGVLNPGDSSSVSVRTDGAGVARAVLNQAQPAAGMNHIQIDLVRPDDERCCKPGGHIATGVTTKQWLAPSIEIDKSAPATAVLGETFPYTIVVTNPSQVDAKGLIVTDPLPAGIEYSQSNPSAEIKDGVLTWRFDKLSARRKRSIRAARTGRFSNCAEVVADGGLNARDCADTEVSAPRLALDLQCVGAAVLCDPLTYTVRVANCGDAAARNVMVTTQLPAGLMTEAGHAKLTFNAGTLAPHESKKATFNLKAGSAGEFNVVAQAAGEGGLTARAECGTRITQPVLVVTKTGPEKRYLGRPATFEISVSNTGDAPARGTILTDTIPPGMRFESATDGVTPSAGSLTWNLGSLAPGATRNVSVTLTAATSGTMHNTATATAYCAESAASTVMNVEGIPAVLLEVVDLDDPVEVGQNVTYEIRVTNQGSADGTGVTLTCTLPPEQEYVGATGPGRVAATGQTITFDPVPTLSPGGVLTYRVTVKALRAGDVRFRATMKTDQTTSVVEETESTHLY
jgi:uncharacterized repeat protein (TIGR01451 family)